MKKFIVIGLGNFGYNVAYSLVESGCEVLGMDTDREVVQKAKDNISHAIIGDASNKEVLESLAIKDFDGAIISIGQDMASSILISLYIIEIGIPRIIVRAVTEDHGKILKMIGVTDVVFPERDMAIRVANKLAMRNAMDYFPIAEDYGVLEVNPPRSFIGQTLKDLQISTRYKCQIIGIKYQNDEDATKNLTGVSGKIKAVPTAMDVITDDSVMIVFGKNSDIEKLQSLD